METQYKIQEELDQVTAAMAGKISKDGLTKVQQGVQDITAYFSQKEHLKVGDTVPDFRLLNYDGSMKSLHDYLKTGDLVLTFFRGEWCPYCNIQLAAYQQRLSEIKDKGANLVAISPNMPDYQIVLKEKHKLSFDVLTDLGGVTAENYGLAFDLPKEIHEVYKNEFNLDISKYNKDGSLRIPLPATYVIGKDKKIKYAFVDIDWAKRAELDDILQVL